MENKESSLSKNAVLNVIKTAMTTMFPVITYMYVSRIFGTSGMGQLGFSKSIITYFQLVSMLGVMNYATSVIAANKKDDYGLCKNAQEILVINFTSMVIAYIAFFICIFCSTKLFSYRVLLLIYATQIFLQVIGVEWLYLGLEDFKYITIRTIFVQVISLIGMFVFVHNKQDLYIYALIQVISNGGANLFNFFHSRKFFFRKKIEKLEIKKHLRPIVFIFFTILFANLFTQLDTTMLGFMKGDDAVGLYSAADKLSSMVSGLIGSLSMVIMPRVAFYKGEGNMKKINKYLTDTICVIFMLSIPISIGMFFFSDYIILWFSGSEFLPAIITAKILAIRVLLAPVNALFVLYFFIPMGMEKRSLLITGVAALLNLLMNSVLIPIISYNGAAIATVSAEILEIIIVFFLFNHDGNKMGSLIEGMKQYCLGCVIVYFICLLNRKIIKNCFLETALSVIISILCYGIVLILMKNQYMLSLLNKIKYKIKNNKE